MTLISVSAKNLGDLDSDLHSLRSEGWGRRFRRGQVGKPRTFSSMAISTIQSPKYPPTQTDN
jgi:hypothetical protein